MGAATHPIRIWLDAIWREALAVASRVRRRSELLPIFGDGLKDQAAAVWA